MGLQALFDSFLPAKRSELVFDAEGATIIGHFTSELAAHRAKRNWTNIFKRYFLLEKERDYETSVLSCPEGDYFALYFFFTSGCGRYAFWRMVNNQAPDAEQKLLDSATKGTRTRRLGTTDLWNTNGPWLLDGDAGMQHRVGLSYRLRYLLRRFF